RLNQLGELGVGRGVGDGVHPGPQSLDVPALLPDLLPDRTAGRVAHGLPRPADTSRVGAGVRLAGGLDSATPSGRIPGPDRGVKNAIFGRRALAQRAGSRLGFVAETAVGACYNPGSQSFPQKNVTSCQDAAGALCTQ